ncbi:hypothetical protein LOD99_126 [Oopsacas minuta]|uniref:Serine-threonine/tyrosine-protein kinase catalytic domain-containing protein n=1 Tax=Oopsacas minuta TaxID=111878 RepID=A0AAV7K8B8_9METZ|nr:hypothetical protein LOD99_126 [Oopsacas minuta]
MTLFEIWTLGDKPWGEATNNEIIENLSLMKTLSPPHGCPEEISRVMLKTWKYDQDDRPTFSETVKL